MKTNTTYLATGFFWFLWITMYCNFDDSQFDLYDLIYKTLGG